MGDDSMPEDTAYIESENFPTEADSLSTDLLEIDYLYESLAHPRRRFLCYSLLEDTQWMVTDLATKIAAWESGIPNSAVTDQQRDQVHVSLYHNHIPKLVDDGVISYDDATEMIAPAERADQVVGALVGIKAGFENASGPTDDENQ